MALQTQFNKFLKDIEPSSTTKTNSSTAHHNLRDFLKGHSSFSTWHIETYLSGSYKRDTAIRPKSANGQVEKPDVDIIVVTSHTLNDKPRDVLNLLLETLKDKYKDPDPVKRDRSVRVVTSTADMDVVPIIVPYQDALYLPDKIENVWRKTNPPRHTEWTTETNKRSGGRFKPLVKLVKWWRRENPTISKRPKGFMIECITAECMNYQETQYAELFIGTLEGIVQRYSYHIASGLVPFIQDPGVPENNVLSHVTPDSFEGFYNKAIATAELGRKALDAGNTEEGLELWRKIFGMRFPRSESLTSKSLLDDAVRPNELTFPDRPVRPNKPGGFA